MLREFRELKSKVCPIPTLAAMSAPLSTPLSRMEACINLKKLNSRERKRPALVLPLLGTRASLSPAFIAVRVGVKLPSLLG